MNIDIWSDVICPFCYIGKRKLELALEDTGTDATIIWHSFELNPDAPPSYGLPLPDAMSRLYGLGDERALQVLQHEEEEARNVGLDFQWRIAKPGNTFNAHRMIHYGKSVGMGDVVKERFLRAYFSEGQEIGDPGVVRALAVETGLDVAAVDRVIMSDEFGPAVREDERTAAALGIRGVPYFIINGQVAISGAQPVEQFVRVLKDQQASVPDGDICADGVCEVKP